MINPFVRQKKICNIRIPLPPAPPSRSFSLCHSTPPVATCLHPFPSVRSALGINNIFKRGLMSLWLGSKLKTHLFNTYLTSILIERPAEYISLVCRYHNAQSPEMLMSSAMKGTSWCSLQECLIIPHWGWNWRRHWGRQVETRWRHPYVPLLSSPHTCYEDWKIQWLMQHAMLWMLLGAWVCNFA